ncbi:DUF6415 family natural product biosynthesis protein [Streptomyces sp. NPDC054775]
MTGTVETNSGAPDIETMRETIDELLDADAVPETLPPSADELADVTSLLRGYLDALMPVVEHAAARLPRNSVARYCALACVGDARRKLQLQPSPAPGGDLAYARRLARALNALCDDYDKLRQAAP